MNMFVRMRLFRCSLFLVYALVTGFSNPVFSVPVINQQDTVIFDFSSQVCTTGQIQVPVFISSDDAVYAIDFELKFNPANFTYASLINFQPFLNNAANFHANDSTLRFTTFSMIAIPNNVPLIALKFNVPAGTLALGSFLTIRTWLNGDDCSYHSVNLPPPPPVVPSGPTEISMGDTVQLSVALPAGWSNLWSTGSTAPDIFVMSPGTYSVVFTNQNGCSFASQIAITMVNPLPVTWLYVKADARESGNLVSWATASETNNDFFLVERSGTGTNWEQVGRKAGMGTSHVPVYYDLLDEQPVTGINYYRIWQTDFDGHSEVSEVVAARRISSSDDSEVDLYPNPWRPGTSGLYISGPGGMYFTRAKLFNSAGVQVATCNPVSVSGDPGIYLIDCNAFQFLAAGIYHLVLSGGGDPKHLMLAVQ